MEFYSSIPCDAVPWPGSYLRQTVKSDHNDVTHPPTKDRSCQRSLRSPGWGQVVCPRLCFGVGFSAPSLSPLPKFGVWEFPGSRCGMNLGDLQENTGDVHRGVSLASLKCQAFTVAQPGGSQKTPRGHLATEKREKHS